MKILKYLKGIGILSSNLFVAFIKSLKALWTNEDVFWNFNETFFYGEGAKEKRDEYIILHDLLIKNLKQKNET